MLESNDYYFDLFNNLFKKVSLFYNKSKFIYKTCYNKVK